MKKTWDKLTPLSQHYFYSMISFIFFWFLLNKVLSFEFVNTLFFSTAFIWHFTLLTPGLREKMLLNKNKYSFLNIVVKINYYLQLFIRIEKFSFGPAIVRAIMPILFTCFLLVMGGSGNILFSVLGSVCFELVFHFCKGTKKTISGLLDDLEIPPTIPPAKNDHV